MKDLTLAEHTMRCPIENCTARVTVRTDAGASPSRRHLEVVACSLVPVTSFVPAARKGYFSDVPPSVSYLCEVDPAPVHTAEITCSKRCLATLNAAESGAAEPPTCTSGVADSFELARQTQSPAMMRLLWTYGA
jgi:hypothetical protein